MERIQWERLRTWNRTWALAVVFGLASVPWTYIFVTGDVPLWPSFIASASFYAAGNGLDGLSRASASNITGIAYAAGTLALAGVVGGGPVALSFVVGGFMLVASLHEFVPLLSFTPGAFFGYATLFSVNAAEATVFGVSGLAGQTLAAILSMFVGAVIGLTTDELSQQLAES